MKKYLIALICLSINPCFAALTIKVMSYNIRNSRANDGINNWGNRKQALANLILKVNPDVLGTQEVRYDQLKDLNSLLPGYKEYGVGRDNGKHGGEHSAIYY